MCKRWGGRLTKRCTCQPEPWAFLNSLLEELTPGEEVVITKGGQPWAQVKKAEQTSWPCRAGSYRKVEFWMAADFDARLDDFKFVDSGSDS